MTDDAIYYTIDLSKELAEVVERDYVGDRTIGDVVRWLYAQGLIDKTKARNQLIKRFYYQQIKYQTAIEARLDCAINYNVSEATVQRIVYDYIP